MEFVPTKGYQFTKWNVIPEGSVSIRNVYDAKTEAIVENSDFSITIEPKVYERPLVTISPGNNVENPRNSTIVIAFSQSMNITEDDLCKIKVLIDDFDGLEYFDPPKLSDDNTKITFIPKRDNLIPVGTVAKIVKVVVPSNFYYIKDEVNILLGQDFEYSFKINSKTETSAEITVSCPSSQGDLNYSGTKVYYLDNEFSVTCTPNSTYSLTGWSVKYQDGTLVEDNVLSIETNSDFSIIKAKLLTGTIQPITLSPVLVKKGTLNISFKAEQGSISPSMDKVCYKGDSFVISYRESSGYAFTGWKVTDATTGDIVENVINFGNTNQTSMEDSCTVESVNRSIFIEAQTEKRPKITAMVPGYENSGVYRDSRIKLIFSQSMSERSIYWTENELTKLGITTENGYEILAAGTREDQSGNQYYYAYRETGRENSVTYKNIKIQRRGTSENLLQYYSVPYFESSDNSVLLIAAKTKEGNVEKCVPSGTDVEVIILPSFFNNKSITINDEFTGCFYTNGETDGAAPFFSDVEFALNVKSGVSISKIENSTTVNDRGEKIDVGKAWENYLTLNAKEDSKNKFNSTDKLEVTVKGKIEDVGSGPDRIEVYLEPLKSSLRSQEEKTLRSSKKVTGDASGKCDFSSGYTFEFKMADLLYEGAYKIVLKGYDKKDNEVVHNKVIGFVYDDGETPKFDRGRFDTLANVSIEPLSLNDSNYNKFSVTIKNMLNSEFIVVTRNDETSVIDFSTYENKYWISTKEVYKPNDFYVYPSAWAPTATDLKKIVYICLRDVFGNIGESTKYTTGRDSKPQPISYSDKPSVTVGNVMKVTSSSSTYIEITLHDKCSGIKKIETQIYSGGKVVEIKNQYSQFNKTFGATFVDDTKTGIASDWSDNNNIFLIVPQLLDSFIAKIWVTDGAGNVSDKVTYSYPQ